MSILEKLASNIGGLSLLEKLAQNVDQESQFGETIPQPTTDLNGVPMQNDPNSLMGHKGPAANIQPEDEYAAVPDESYMPEEEMGPGPEEVGAMTAQAFLGPDIIQAAMSGDVNAQEIMGRAAGHIARATTESAMNFQGGMQGGQPMGDMQQMQDMGQGGYEQAPQNTMTSPEEDLASAIAPNIQ